MKGIGSRRLDGNGNDVGRNMGIDWECWCVNRRECEFETHSRSPVARAPIHLKLAYEFTRLLSRLKRRHLALIDILRLLMAYVNTPFPKKSTVFSTYFRQI